MINEISKIVENFGYTVEGVFLSLFSKKYEYGTLVTIKIKEPVIDIEKIEKEEKYIQDIFGKHFVIEIV